MANSKFRLSRHVARVLPSACACRMSIVNTDDLPHPLAVLARCLRNLLLTVLREARGWPYRLVVTPLLLVDACDANFVSDSGARFAIPEQAVLVLLMLRRVRGGH